MHAYIECLDCTSSLVVGTGGGIDHVRFLLGLAAGLVSICVVLFVLVLFRMFVVRCLLTTLIGLLVALESRPVFCWLAGHACYGKWIDASLFLLLHFKVGLLLPLPFFLKLLDVHV